MRDIRLAEALEFARPRVIRELIQRNKAELERYGSLPCRTAVIEAGKGAQHEVEEYWLTEAQALLICFPRICAAGQFFSLAKLRANRMSANEERLRASKFFPGLACSGSADGQRPAGIGGCVPSAHARAGASSNYLCLRDSRAHKPLPGRGRGRGRHRVELDARCQHAIESRKPPVRRGVRWCSIASGTERALARAPTSCGKALHGCLYRARQQ